VSIRRAHSTCPKRGFLQNVSQNRSRISIIREPSSWIPCGYHDIRHTRRPRRLNGSHLLAIALRKTLLVSHPCGRQEYSTEGRKTWLSRKGSNPFGPPDRLADPSFEGLNPSLGLRESSGKNDRQKLEPRGHLRQASSLPQFFFWTAQWSEGFWKCCDNGQAKASNAQDTIQCVSHSR